MRNASLYNKAQFLRVMLVDFLAFPRPLWPPSSTSPSALLLYPFTQPSTPCSCPLAKTELLTFSKHMELHANSELLHWLQWLVLTFRPHRVVLTLSEPVRRYLVRRCPHSPLPAPLHALCPLPPQVVKLHLCVCSVTFVLCLYFSYCPYHAT